MQYRPDIDGLRALAVLSVIFFHFGFTFLGGGYVGVDIFFVISGFLITAIIKKDLDQQSFTFSGFYYRRIKRILPALYVMITATYAVAWVFLFPKEFSEFSASAAAAVMNAANLLFWKKAGYFDLGNEFKPLLHTWSLAVEEQFYMLYPLMMYMIYRFFPKRAFSVTAVAALLSFGLSYYIQEKAPSANFYLIPTRAWELAIGSLAALAPPLPRLHTSFRSIGAALGLGLIAVPLFAYTENTVFPGLAAAPVCIGAVLLIISGARAEDQAQTLYHKFISAPFFLWVGKISYSLYLWHWPVFIFVNLIWGLTPVSIAGMFALTFAFGYLSYRFVETPFRVGAMSAKKMAIILSLWSIFLIVLGGLGVKYRGFADRFPAETKNYFSGQFDYDSDLANCAESPAAVLDSKACVIGASAKTGVAENPKILLWGDSHGRSFTRAIKSAADRAGTSFYARNMGGCLPGLGDIWSGRELCRVYGKTVFDFIRQENIRHVVLVARWSFYRNGSEGKVHAKMYDRRGKITGEALRTAFDQSFEDLIVALREAGVRVTIVGQVPSFDVHIPEFAARKHLWWDQKFAEQERNLTDHGKYLAVNEAFDKKYTPYFQEKKITVIDPGAILCPGPGVCLTEKDGYALYRDTNHLSAYGAETLSPLFDRVFFDE